MRGYGLFLIIFFLIFGFNQANAGLGGPVDTVDSYFKACRNGDIETMKMLIAGSFYDKNKVLLLKNKDYPEFLKNYYRDVNITIVSSSIGNIDMVAKDYPKLYERYHLKEKYKSVAGNSEISVVKVSREFSDGSILSSELLLKKDEKGNWKIYTEVFGQ